MLPRSSGVEADIGSGDLDSYGPLLAPRLDGALRGRSMPLLLDVAVDGNFEWLAWLAWLAVLHLHRRNPGKADVGVFARPDFALRLDRLACDVAVGEFCSGSLGGDP